MSISSVTGASNYATIAFDQESLTPEGMMLYLSTRMEEVDGQINALFDKQKASQEIRNALGEIQTELGRLDENAAHDQRLYMPGYTGQGSTDVEQKILVAIDKIAAIDPKLAETMRVEMGVYYDTSQILSRQDGVYYSREVKATKGYIDTIVRELDATAQMDMIRLQSHMSARQTAIQLSTNLIASMTDSMKAVVSNIRP